MDLRTASTATSNTANPSPDPTTGNMLSGPLFYSWKGERSVTSLITDWIRIPTERRAHVSTIAISGSSLPDPANVDVYLYSVRNRFPIPDYDFLGVVFTTGHARITLDRSKTNANYIPRMQGR